MLSAEIRQLIWIPFLDYAMSSNVLQGSSPETDDSCSGIQGKSTTI